IPSIPESTRCSCRLHQVPTRPNCPPYFLKTESSPTQVHCQRLRVAALALAAWRHKGSDACWLCHVFSRLVSLGTWCTPSQGLSPHVCESGAASAHHAPTTFRFPFSAICSTPMP